MPKSKGDKKEDLLNDIDEYAMRVLPGDTILQRLIEYYAPLDEVELDRDDVPGVLALGMALGAFHTEYSVRILGSLIFETVKEAKCYVDQIVQDIPIAQES